MKIAYLRFLTEGLRANIGLLLWSKLGNVPKTSNEEHPNPSLSDSASPAHSNASPYVIAAPELDHRSLWLRVEDIVRFVQLHLGKSRKVTA